MTEQELQQALARDGLTNTGEWRLRVGFLEERTAGLESAFSKRLDQVTEGLAQVRSDVAGLRGYLAGYLVGAAILGTIVAFLAQRVLR